MCTASHSQICFHRVKQFLGSRRHNTPRVMLCPEQIRFKMVMVGKVMCVGVKIRAACSKCKTDFHCPGEEVPLGIVRVRERPYPGLER